MHHRLNNLGPISLTVNELRLILDTDPYVPDPRFGSTFVQRILRGTPLVPLDVVDAPDDQDEFTSLCKKVTLFLQERGGPELRVEINRRDMPVIDDQAS